jgi:methylenetetrahydrofolate dehydrogenase (NADP+) / methenyltetrahydrofolate cyclohydrolase
MGPIVLDGKLLASLMENDLKRRVNAVVGRLGRVPVLATVLVGDDPSSEIYVNMKGNACRRIGIESKKIKLARDVSTDEVLRAIDELNRDTEVFGILLQHPVPAQVNESECFNAISIAKDVDGVTALGFGMMSLNQPAFRCATPGGIMKLLDHYGVAVEGKNAVVAGRSPILGKPVAMMLLNANATVTICHSKTRGLPEIVRNADIIVGAVGKPEFIRADWIKTGAVIIDAGYHPGGIGDIEKTAFARSAAYTPVPGGVGPMTIATLMSQMVEAAEKALATP